LTKFFLDQHGCAKNQVDGEALLAGLCREGYARTLNPAEADLIVINSCGFIEDAKKESLQAVFQARAAYPGAKIVLTGCLARRYAGDFAQGLPEADAVFGDAVALGMALPRVLRGERVVDGGFSLSQEGLPLRQDLLSPPGSAYVKITEGCGNRCSYCAIPAIRGPLRSRSPKDILYEITDLLSRGIREINLVGQDLAVYGTDLAPADGIDSPLSHLLRGISSLQGDFWARLFYLHPGHFPLDILGPIADDRRILPYFDIPFQSGSDPVLRAMHRPGTAAGYIALVEEIRARLAVRPPVFRTTFLCGFPGETEEDAQATERFLRLAAPDWSGAFAFSREDGTPAYSFKKQVPRKTARDRARRLEEIQEEITARKLAAWVGSEQSVLVEELLAAAAPDDDSGPDSAEDSSGAEDFALARAWFQAPEVDGVVVIRREHRAAPLPFRPGDLVRVRITAVRAPDVIAEWME
jgi:ribosomal protein S12 methylthiotransferase